MVSIRNVIQFSWSTFNLYSYSLSRSFRVSSIRRRIRLINWIFFSTDKIGFLTTCDSGTIRAMTHGARLSPWAPKEPSLHKYDEISFCERCRSSRDNLAVETLLLWSFVQIAKTDYRTRVNPCMFKTSAVKLSRFLGETYSLKSITLIPVRRSVCLCLLSYM